MQMRAHVMLERTYSKKPTGAWAPTSLLTAVAPRAADLAVWAAGAKAAAEAARIKARTTRILMMK